MNRTQLLFLSIFLCFVALLYTGCESLPVENPPVVTEPLPVEAGPAPTPTPEPQKAEPLAWIRGYDGRAGSSSRAPWSDHLILEIEKYFDSLDGATDMGSICPRYPALGRGQKINAWAELFALMARYESSWKPETLFYECNKKTPDGKACSTPETCRNPYKSARWDADRGWCMKGGHSLDGGYVISRGLLQMSLQSSQSYGCSMMKKPADLHQPLENLSCGVRILANRVEKYKKAMFNDGHYWSVMKSTSGSNPKIRAGMKAFALCAAP